MQALTEETSQAVWSVPKSLSRNKLKRGLLSTSIITIGNRRSNDVLILLWCYREDCSLHRGMILLFFRRKQTNGAPIASAPNHRGPAWEACLRIRRAIMRAD